MATCDLSDKKCKPCEGGVAPMTLDEITLELPKLVEWHLSADHKSISRSFQFKNFYRTMAFVNAIAWIANQENHHPDLEVGYNYCHVKFTTHAIDGLSENDFICAAKIDRLES
jgi:4a-hydroxytetrahydrobiopterin dehydratase